MAETTPILELDHVVVAVADLEEGAERLRVECRLASVPGGRHRGHGTANVIVPLAGTYLELMAVVDLEEAATSAMGRYVGDFAAAGGGPMAVCLRTEDVATVAARRHLSTESMSRLRPDGTELRWRMAGVDRALRAESFPFFIQWMVAPGDHPAETPVTHPGGPAVLDRVVVRGDEDALRRWLGGPVPGLVVASGAPGVAEVVLTVGGAPVVLPSGL